MLKISPVELSLYNFLLAAIIIFGILLMRMLRLSNILRQGTSSENN